MRFGMEGVKKEGRREGGKEGRKEGRKGVATYALINSLLFTPC